MKPTLSTPYSKQLTVSKSAKGKPLHTNQQSLVKMGERLERLERDVALGRQAVPTKPVKPRNYLALNPLLQKGGVHEKDDVALARKRQRRATRQQLKKQYWLKEEN